MRLKPNRRDNRGCSSLVAAGNDSQPDGIGPPVHPKTSGLFYIICPTEPNRTIVVGHIDLNGWAVLDMISDTEFTKTSGSFYIIFTTKAFRTAVVVLIDLNGVG